jgi:hypothetical protein
MDTIRQKMALGMIVAVLLISSISASFQPIKAQSSITLAPCPSFDSSKFSESTKITNPHLPMTPGTVSVYPGVMNGNPQVSIVNITHQTRMIDSVMTIVVNDTVKENGKEVETTLDYYAQDNSGNVWYMGEDALQIKNGKVIGNSGSWLGGVSGAQPGFIMEAHPKVGDFYCQESSPGVAQDQAKVISVSSSVCVPWVCANNHVLLTEETSPLDPGAVEDKWYVRNIGNAMAKDVAGGQDETQLAAVLQT